jgi:hypothetical protein
VTVPASVDLKLRAGIDIFVCLHYRETVNEMLISIHDVTRCIPSYFMNTCQNTLNCLYITYSKIMSTFAILFGMR